MKGKYQTFKPWKPERWTSFCAFSGSDGKYTTVLNNQVVIELSSEDYQKAHQLSSTNISLLNVHKQKKHSYPYLGSITDVNVWDKALSQVEIGQFSKCQLEGNYLKWSEASFEVSDNIKVSDISAEKVCSEKRTSGTTWICSSSVLIKCTQDIGTRMEHG